MPAISAGTVRQVRPDTDHGSAQQPLHISDQRLLIGPLQNGLDGVLVQGVLGCILPTLQSIHMPELFGQQAGPKHADCHDAIRPSEGHVFAHQRFCIVGVTVLGAEKLDQFVLAFPDPGLGRRMSSVSLMPAKSIQSMTPIYLGSRIPFLHPIHRT
jgi:hypothetical protein